MTTAADRIETLVKRRIEQNRSMAGDIPRLSGARFRPLQLTGVSASPVGRDYQRQRWSVGELLGFYDRQFVQNAYLVLLKRDADVEGLNQRLQLLHSGQVSRVELLFRLRYGSEGKLHNTVVRGLARAFLIERICRIPVLGIVPRYLRALAYLPRMQRELEELRGLIAMQKNDADSKSQAIIDFQNEHFERIIRHLGR
jgi:O-antigen chain-terminating methyltransferase